MTDASQLLRATYEPIIREHIEHHKKMAEVYRIAMHGFGPYLAQTMPLELDPSNTWYWLPADWEKEECDCE